jgi:hypothetical protein
MTLIPFVCLTVLIQNVTNEYTIECYIHFTTEGMLLYLLVKKEISSQKQ